MIKAEFKKNGSLFVGFNVTGHAGYAPSGYDIVCAAASTLSQATIIGICQVLGHNFSEVVTEGHVECLAITNNTRHKEDIDLLVSTMYFALIEVEKAYKDFIQVCTIDVESNIINISK